MSQFIDFKTPGGLTVVVNKEHVLFFKTSQTNQGAETLKMLTGVDIPVMGSQAQVQQKLNEE